MAKSRMIYGAAQWERFHVRNVALKMARRNVSSVFDLLPNVPREIVAAKRGRYEGDYLRLTARTKRFRDAIIRLGTR